MIYVQPRFKAPRAPKVKAERARDRRPGMDPEHLANIRRLSSCLSGTRPVDPHHLRCAGGRGIGLKEEDRWSVPLTREEHTGPRGVHSVPGNGEYKWFLERGINCLELAAALWTARGNIERMQRIVDAHRETARKWLK